jgi:hypothetical protein
MVKISLILYTKGFFGSILKSPTQMGSLSINNSVTNISRLGTFKTEDDVPVGKLKEKKLIFFFYILKSLKKGVGSGAGSGSGGSPPKCHGSQHCLIHSATHECANERKKPETYAEMFCTISTISV